MTQSSFYCIFKFYFNTLCFVLVVYCGAPALRMRGALTNDMVIFIHTIMCRDRQTDRPDMTWFGMKYFVLYKWRLIWSAVVYCWCSSLCGAQLHRRWSVLSLRSRQERHNRMRHVSMSWALSGKCTYMYLTAAQQTLASMHTDRCWIDE